MIDDKVMKNTAIAISMLIAGCMGIVGVIQTVFAIFKLAELSILTVWLIVVSYSISSSHYIMVFLISTVLFLISSTFLMVLGAMKLKNRDTYSITKKQSVLYLITDFLFLLMGSISLIFNGGLFSIIILLISLGVAYVFIGNFFKERKEKRNALRNRNRRLNV